MERRLEELEKKVAALTSTVEELQAKFAASQATAPVAQRELEAEHEAPAAPTGPVEPVLPLLGRTLLSFAGAFVFRALTDRAIVASGLGVALGLVFGAVWVVLAWRDADRGKRLSATFHAVAAALINYPLVIETASRLQVLSAPVAAVALAAFTLALVGTAWHCRMPVLAWLGAVGGGGSAAVLLFTTTDSPAPFRVVLWGVALATIALADGRAMPGVRWPIALLVDGLILRDLLAPPAAGDARLGEGPLAALALSALYVGALAWRTWGRRLAVETFEVAQTLAAVALGLWVLSRAQVRLDVPTLVLSLGALATAVHLGARTDRREDGWFYGLVSVGLALLSGVKWSITGIPLAALWGALALTTAALGRWRLPGMMWGFSAVFSWAAAGAGGVLSCIKSGLLDAAPTEWSVLSLGCMATLAVPLASYLVMTIRLPQRTDTAVASTALATLVLVLLGSVAASAYAVRLASANASVVIISRTLVLIVLAIAVVLLRRLGGPRELAWSAAFLLALCGLKLVVQDLPNGNALTLVVGFLTLGAAVSLLPKFVKGRPATSQ